MSQQIRVTFPDGSQRSFPAGITPLEIAAAISPSLAKKVLVARIDDTVRDAFTPLHHDVTLRLLTWDDPEGKAAFWHSSAHLLAEALEALYPGIKFGYGPPIEQGFYYDVDLGSRRLTEADLEVIEKKMAELAAQNNNYVRIDISKSEALKYFEQKGDPYKVETILELNDGEISFYRQGNFVDLCRGPHIPSTGYIKAIKLTNIAGAYWKGDAKNKQLTRIYGISFPKQKDLDDFLHMQELARQRDHRKLGKELGIFIFDDDVGPGLPLWLPNGGVLIEQLEKLAKKTEEEAGYVRVRTPHIAKESMYLTSGHLPYYQDSMFPPMELEGIRYYLKAMNCPHHHKIYAAEPRSYRDLPLRIAEYGTVYRYEQSGELFGLMRVRCMNMNDAHIYCTEDQFAEEFRAVNEMYLRYFKIFGIEKYVMRFSTHDPAKRGQKYLDLPELWQKTEDMVRRVLIESKIPFVEVPDEAAFYGPKVDVQIWSVIGREFTLATNQVDFGQPLRFGLTYIDRNNQPQTPIVIHRAPLGTHERFIGFLIEHYAGSFPLWLAPVQVAVLPVADRHLEYAQKVLHQLKQKRLRVQLLGSDEKIGKRIRTAEIAKIPYMFIVGDREAADGTVSVRQHGKGDLGSMATDAIIDQLVKQRAEVLGD
ncbi:MAG: threonine--tRNA ligase [Chitinophagales bacterium]|nr:threonine--tRNA ligase [Chitinophagales bacterium]MDW8427853.1 threonine--tRNA ligase [Chitinophagales bacterium]